MGTSNSKKELEFKEDEWEKVDETSYYDIMRNKDNGVLAENHEFVLPSENKIKEETKIYENRANPIGRQVRVLAAQLDKSGMCGNHNVARVLTERIPIRFIDSKPLNKDQEAMVLYNLFRGYEELYRQHGPMDINNKMFGFNPQGQLKVWLNENFGKNQPPRTLNFNEFRGREEPALIQRLVELVDEKTEQKRVSQPLRSELLKRTTISHACDCITQVTNIPIDFLNKNFVLQQQPILNQPVEKVQEKVLQSYRPEPMVPQRSTQVVGKPTINVSYQSTSQPLVHRNTSYQSSYQPHSFLKEQPVSYKPLNSEIKPFH